MTSVTPSTRGRGARRSSIRLIIRPFNKLVVSLVAALVLTTTAYSWGNPGHMAVALIAYRRLDPATRARVDTLVALNPRINQWRALLPPSASQEEKKTMLFMLAATWPDQIKDRQCPSQGPKPPGCYEADGTGGGNIPPADGSGFENLGYSSLKLRKYWHFKDVGFSTDGTPIKNPPVPNAETQINTFRTVLGSTTASDELKSFDLVWLLHLVGDVHQPLHCTARFTAAHLEGDDGGNKVTVCPPQQNCKKLHSYWDGLYGSTLDLREGLRQAYDVPPLLGPAPSCQAGDLVTSNWIREGFELAKAVVYSNPPIKNANLNHNLTVSYERRAKLVAGNQIALAGERLARVLNVDLR